MLFITINSQISSTYNMFNFTTNNYYQSTHSIKVSIINQIISYFIPKLYPFDCELESSSKQILPRYTFFILLIYNHNSHLIISFDWC